MYNKCNTNINKKLTSRFCNVYKIRIRKFHTTHYARFGGVNGLASYRLRLVNGYCIAQTSIFNFGYEMFDPI